MFHLVRSISNKQQIRHTGIPITGPRRKSEHLSETESTSRDRSSSREHSAVLEVASLFEDTQMFSRPLLLTRSPPPWEVPCSQPSWGPLLSRDFRSEQDSYNNRPSWSLLTNSYNNRPPWFSLSVTQHGLPHVHNVLGNYGLNMIFRKILTIKRPQSQSL